MAALVRGGDVLVAHAAFVAGRLGTRATVLLFDVLELYAFVRPGLPLVPSALGLARRGTCCAAHAGRIGAGAACHCPQLAGRSRRLAG